MNAPSSPLQTIFKAFRDQQLVVVGDVMLDRYLIGNSTRLSPEAPVPILDVERIENRLGGAANVALNLHGLGASVHCLSVLGDDEAGHHTKHLMQQHHLTAEGLFLHQDRRSTVKNRIFAKNQQMFRFDEEMRSPISDANEILLFDKLLQWVEEKDIKGIILQDYNKGVLTPKVIANVLQIGSKFNIPVAVDPKLIHFDSYKGCHLFKPNLKEVRNGLQQDITADIESLDYADKLLRKRLQHQQSVITLAEKGIYVNNGESSAIIPALNKTVYDVSGAGDTVLAVMAMGMTLNLDLSLSAELANLAAAIVCERVGVYPINAADMNLALQDEN